MATPTILDTLPVAHNTISGTSLSFSYTVPAGGTNKLFVVVWFEDANTGVSAISLNNVDMSSSVVLTTGDAVQSRYQYYAYLAAPTTGTFSVTFPTSQTGELYAFTVQDAAQASPIDVSHFAASGSANTITSSATTTVGNDMLLAWGTFFNGQTFSSFGASETNALTLFNNTTVNYRFTGSWKPAAASGGSESMTLNISGNTIIQNAIMAIKLATASPASRAGLGLNLLGVGQ